ncbi:hypothetical protein ACQB60_31850 [Actinomycetota bacterium Odt1-20B]
MSEICNAAAQLTLDSLRDKKRLAQNAGQALLGASSDLHKALEFAEHGDSNATITVYVAAAEKQLRNAVSLLDEVAGLLASGGFSAETIAWLRSLDYDRLYRTGIASGVLPRSAELWAELADMTVAEGPLGVCRDYRDRVARAADLMADWLAHPEADTAVAELTTLEAALLDVSLYARFLGYVNDVKPLDQQWVRPAADLNAR